MSRERSLARLLVLVLPSAVVLVLVLVGWQLAVQSSGVSRLVVPTPTSVAGSLADHRVELWRNSIVTLSEALGGLLLGTGFALLCAVAVVYSPLLRSSAYPLVLAAQAIPLVALAPVLAIWLGTGMLPKVMLAAFLAYTVTLVIMVKGLGATDEPTLELMHTPHGRRSQELFLVRVPASLPFLFTALKLSASAAVVAAIAAEYIGSLDGLGFLIQTSRKHLQTDFLWATVVVAGAIGMASYGALALLERRVLRWQPDDVTHA